ncbi:Tetraspanin-31-like, partial [Homarus americanus]
GWQIADTSTRKDAQNFFGCCGYDFKEGNKTKHLDHPSCEKVTNKESQLCCPDEEYRHCCSNITTASDTPCPCQTCDKPIQKALEKDFNVVGGIGLFFSFTESDVPLFL